MIPRRQGQQTPVGRLATNTEFYRVTMQQINYKLQRHKMTNRCNSCKYDTFCSVVKDLEGQLKAWQTKVLTRSFI